MRFISPDYFAHSIWDKGKSSEVSAAPAVIIPVKLVPVASADYMFVKGESKNKFPRINYADILFVEGLKNYVSIYVSQQRVVTYQTLRDLEAQLPQPHFYRVHKSYIISIDKVSMVDGNTLYIQAKEIPLGENYREGFFKLIREKDQLG